MIRMILISICLLTVFSCDEAEELLDNAGLSISGTYTINDVMMYPNSDCSGTPVSGVCVASDSITVETDCPDSSWVSYISEFDGWSINFADDNETVTLDDGMETDTLTYSISTNTLVIADSDSSSETITITLTSDNSTVEANLNVNPSCSITQDQDGVYTTEELCVEAGFDWDPAQCIGLVLTLVDTNNQDGDDDDDGPPECVSDCPNFDLIEDGCDGEDCNTADADCAIVASWENHECLADCAGDDADEVTMVMDACTECTTAGTDCEEALDDIYDDSIWDNPLDGTWNMMSVIMDINITIDIGVVASSMDEDDCESIGTYVDSTCILSDAVLESFAPQVCGTMNGQLDGLLCSYGMVESNYYSDTEWQTIHITAESDSSASMTIISFEDGEEETLTGTVSTYGTNIYWGIDGEPTLPGTYSIVDNTATLNFVYEESDNILDLIADDEMDEAFAESITSVSGAITMTMIRPTEQ